MANPTNTLFKQASKWNDIGNQQLHAGDTKSALKSYEKAVKLLPNSVDIHKNIILLLLKTSNADNQKILNYVYDHDLLKMETNSVIQIPTIASFVGVALYNLNRLDESILMFEHVVQKLTPNDVNTWSNLGDTYLHKYNIESAVNAYKQLLSLLKKEKEKAKDNGKSDANANAIVQYSVSLYRASSWGCDWSRWDTLESMAIALLEGRLKASGGNTSDMKKMTRTFGDFVDVSPIQLKIVNERHSIQVSQNYQNNEIDQNQRQGQIQDQSESEIPKIMKQLKIGFISSDFGVHPVSSLIRGLLQKFAPDSIRFNSSDLVTYVYIRTNDQSWWRENITNMYSSNIRSLYGTSYEHSVATIQADTLDVLVDLNGWTMHSGLELLANSKRLATVHVTFLGYSMTTGSSFVDYYMTDTIATEIETSKYSFTEKLVLTGGSFFANDYVGLQSHVVWKENQEEKIKYHEVTTLNTILLPKRDYSVSKKNTDETLLQSALDMAKMKEQPPIIYACFSDFRKMDPTLFDSWMNILRKEPLSFLWLIKHHKLDSAVTRLKMEAVKRGVASYRIVVTSKEPWINHIFTKRTADVILDTRRTNGHTSNADGLWGGVPVLTLQGKRMGTRITSSLLTSLSGWENLTNEKTNKYELKSLITRTMKTYENVASKIVSHCSCNKKYRTKTFEGGRLRNGSRLLRRLRTVLRQNRIKSGLLFDIDSYSNMFLNRLKTMVEVKKSVTTKISTNKAMHIFPGPSICRKDGNGGLTQRPRRYCVLKRSKEKKEIELETSMPKDPHTKNFYSKKPVTKTLETPPSTVDTVPLMLLHYCEPHMSRFTPTPNGWKSSTNLLTFQKDSITAIYLTLVENEETYLSSSSSVSGIAALVLKERLTLLIQESRRVLLNGGALFITVPDDTNYNIDVIRQLLTSNQFCNFQLMNKFGSFDVHNKIDDRKLIRISTRVCGKNGPKINVQLQ